MQTFEQVQAHVEKHSKNLPRTAGKKVSASKLKDIYLVARPILALVAGLPLIPKKWRDIVRTLLAALDAVTANPAEQ